MLTLSALSLRSRPAVGRWVLLHPRASAVEMRPTIAPALLAYSLCRPISTNILTRRPAAPTGAPPPPTGRPSSTAANEGGRPLSIERELPQIKSHRTWKYLGLAGGLAIWVVGMGAAFNYQRLSSTAVTNTLFVARHHPAAIEALGEPITFAYGWPWISGTINQLKGIVEIEFGVRGSRAAGQLLVKTYRQGQQWSDQVFQIRLDNGTIVNFLESESLLGSTFDKEPASGVRVD
ncbi:cytochrome oxidase assembly protein 1 [Tieghemiomyces parasiticus]|uniref:Cytochrome oxidase assembly protein 1 n=1 Tax=Tieghemiomyces parasiticus TaxID=78921 RepID=A0A9W7ZQN1_9FUNG|nr:cytochrome oxidase assembly protein 1 [Tieghemiomyces parasiticus]